MTFLKVSKSGSPKQLLNPFVGFSIPTAWLTVRQLLLAKFCKKERIKATELGELPFKALSVAPRGLRTEIPEEGIKEGDVISIRERSRQLVIVLEAVGLTERDVPDYLDVDHNKMTATFVRTPALGDIPYAVQMEPNLVVEFYAKN